MIFPRQINWSCDGQEMHYNEISNYSIYNITKKEKKGRKGDPSLILLLYWTKPFENLF